MAFRADIIAGKAVIIVSIQDTIDKQLRSIRTKMFNFSNAMNKIGQDLTLFGSIGTVGAIFPVKEFISFQDSILFLQTKLVGFNVDIQALEKYIRELGRTTSFTSQQVAEAAAVLAQAGLGEKVQGTLLPVLDLARGARVELDVAGRILANILTAYDISADRAQEIASKLTVASRLGTLDIVDLGESSKELLGTFRTLGVPFESAIALITSLSNVSIRGTKAGTSLNTAFANLASKLPQLQELGIFINPDDFKNPIIIFQKINDELSKLAQTAQVAELQSLFNIRGGRAVSGVNIQGLEKLQEILDKIGESTDEARQSALLLDSGLGGVARRGLSAFQEALISIGATTEGPLSKAGKVLQDIFTNISKVAEDNPKFVQTLLLIPPAALAVGASLLALSLVTSRMGLLISPVIALNGLLFSSLYKLTSLNLTGLGKGLQLGLAPLTYLSQKVGAENAAVFKAQERIAKAKRKTDITKGLKALAEAEAKRSFLTRPRSLVLPRGSSLVGGALAGIGAADRGISGVLGAAKSAPSARTAYFGLARVLGDVAEKAADVKGNYFGLAKSMGNVAEGAQKAGKTGYFRLAFVLGNIAEKVTNLKGLYFGLARVLGNGAEAFSRGFGGKASKSFEFGIQGVLKTFRALGTGFKGFFSVLGGIRSFVFSASGILTIIEFLIIAGPKIPFIARGLDALGRGFKGLFSALGATGIAVMGGLKDVFGGIKELATGDIGKGIEQILFSFAGIRDVIGTGLSLAWQKFLAETSKGLNVLKAAGESLMAIFGGLGAVLGGVFGTIFGGTGRGTIELRDPNSSDSPAIAGIRLFTNLVLGVIESIGKQLIHVADILRQILNLLAHSFATVFNTIYPDKAGRERAINILPLDQQEIVRTEELVQKLQGQLNTLNAKKVATLGILSVEDQKLEQTARRNLAIYRARLAEIQGASENILQTQLSAFEASMNELKDGVANGLNGFQENLDKAQQNFLRANIRLRSLPGNRAAGFGVLQNLPSFPQVLDNLGPLFESIKDMPKVITIELPEVDLGKDIAEGLATSKKFATSIVGSFSSTQGQKLQAVTVDVQKEIRDGVDDMNDKLGKFLGSSKPMVFQA